MKYEKYMEMPHASIPVDIAEKLQMAGGNSILEFEDKNKILTDDILQMEVGYSKMKNGDYVVSMYCPMPGVTAQMVEWFFWWHPQEKERYQLWFPGEHMDTGYEKSKEEYFHAKKMPEFQPNTQYPIERIGKVKMPLSISFVSPEEFGFDRKLMKEANVATVICGHVGAFRGILQHTEMAHVYLQREDGLLMVSRFWIGKRLKNQLIRKIMLTDEIAKGMAEHCCVEYRNLAKKLPMLYAEFG